MKSLKHLLVLILLSLTVLATVACGEDTREFDPSLDVIVDENTGAEAKADIDQFSISVVYDESLGAVSYRKSGNALILDAMLGANTVLIGWYTNENMSGEPIATSTTASIPATALAEFDDDGRVTLYAKLCEKFAVSYRLGGGRFVGASGMDTYLSDKNEIALPYNVQKDGASFAGWRISSTGQTVYALPEGTRGDITLTAVWDEHGEQYGALENTVWRLVLSEELVSFDTEMYIVLSPNGTADIFSGSNGVYLNSGAALAMTHRLYKDYAGGGEVDVRDMAKRLIYDCSTAYFTYTRAEGGVDIKFNTAAYDRVGSYYYDFASLYAGEFTYSLTLTDNGEAIMSVNVPERVTYGGNTYDAEEWQSYVLSLTDLSAIDKSAIEYTYTSQTLPITLVKECDGVSNLDLRVFSAMDCADASYTLDGVYRYTKGACFVVAQNGSLMPAFMLDGSVTVFSAMLDLFDIVAYGAYTFSGDTVELDREVYYVTLPVYSDYFKDMLG